MSQRHSQKPFVRRFAIAVTLVGTAAAPAALAEPLYRLTVLPPLPDAVFSLAFALNDNGQTGGLSGAPAIIQPVVWDPSGTPTAYPILSGGNEAHVLALNNAGTAAGLSVIATTPPPRAVRWTSPTSIEQIVPESAHAPGGVSVALAINDGGTIVGGIQPGPDANVAFVWQPSTGFEDLGEFNGKSTVLRGINGSDVAVGGAFDIDPATGQPIFATLQAIRWTADGGYEALAMPSGTVFTDAADINALGQIVGVAATAAGPFVGGATVWDTDGTPTILPSLPDLGFALGEDINAAGLVVGWSTAEPFGPTLPIATLWNEAGVFDLNDLIAPGSGYTLNQALGVNERGQIAGIATGPNGAQIGFLLTPVPAPGVAGLFGLGIASLLAKRRQRLGRAVAITVPDAT